VAAFAIGAGVAIPGFLLRAGSGPGVADAINVLAVAAVAATLPWLWTRIEGYVPAAAVGAATALGFAVSIHRRVLVSLLSMFLTMIAGFTRDVPLYQAARRMLVQAFPGGPEELIHLVLWQRNDQFLYYGVAPVVAAGAAAAAAAVRRKVGARRDRAR
jgi:hypothetical protein